SARAAAPALRSAAPGNDRGDEPPEQRAETCDGREAEKPFGGRGITAEAREPEAGSPPTDHEPSEDLVEAEDADARHHPSGPAADFAAGRNEDQAGEQVQQEPVHPPRREVPPRPGSQRAPEGDPAPAQSRPVQALVTGRTGPGAVERPTFPVHRRPS